MSNLKNSKTAIIITTYKPDSGFYNRFENLKLIVDYLIVVDNSPGGYAFEDRSNFIFLQDGVNKGLGKALNIGVCKALELGCDAVALFDQDSSPSQSFILDIFNRVALAKDNKICFGPALIDNVTGKSIYSKHHNALVPSRVTCLPTSGMCFQLGNIGNNDLFSDDLFLDFVDFDWCWRLGTRGWSFYRINSIEMEHRLGIGQKSCLGIKYHIPAPFRHYFQFRDTLVLIRRNYVPIYAKFRLGLILIPKFLIYPFILDHGIERLRWMILGIRDSMRSVRGVGAAAKKLM